MALDGFAGCCLGPPGLGLWIRSEEVCDHAVQERVVFVELNSVKVGPVRGFCPGAEAMMHDELPSKEDTRTRQVCRDY